MTPSAGPTEAGPETPAEIPKPSWIQVAKRILVQVKHDNLTDRAAALTYYGVLALFPGLLALVSILGFVGHSVTSQVLNNLGQIAPGGVRSFLTSAVNHVQGRTGAASAALIIGVLLAVWSASGYIAAFMRASNAVYNIDEGRPAWQTYPVRLATTIALMVLLIVSSLLVVLTGQVASQVGRALGVGSTFVTVWDIAKWPVLLILVSLMFSLLYWACPNVKQPGFRWISPGGLVATGVWIVASALFAVYVSFSGSYNKTYGSLATVIIFLVWLWITNLAVLIGVEFNAETQHQRLIEAGLHPAVEPFVELRSTAKLDDEEKDRVARADEERGAIQ